MEKYTEDQLIDLTPEDLKKLENPRYTLKTNGDSEWIVVDNPDYYYDGRFKKHRNNMTHLTPKKKKRK